MPTVQNSSFGHSLRDYSRVPDLSSQGRNLLNQHLGFESCIAATLSPIAEYIGLAQYVSGFLSVPPVSLSSSLRQRIRELHDLKVNWDGEGAKPVKPIVLANLIEVLKGFLQYPRPFREPFLVPTFEGFVQIEWHDARRSLEIEAVDQGWSLHGTLNGREGNHPFFTGECEWSDIDSLLTFYKWFLGEELLWPS